MVGNDKFKANDKVWMVPDKYWGDVAREDSKYPGVVIKKLSLGYTVCGIYPHGYSWIVFDDELKLYIKVGEQLEFAFMRPEGAE